MRFGVLISYLYLKMENYEKAYEYSKSILEECSYSRELEELIVNF
jgi:hypothetical protein